MTRRLQGQPAEKPTYSSWQQAAGYFDGDGNVGLEVVRWVLRFKLRFVDTWKPQIESMSSFLASMNLACGSIGEGDKRGDWQAAYRLDIVEIESVLAAAKAMMPYTVKKRAELKVVIDYLEGRMTGDQAIRAFNEGVNSGKRRGKIRKEGTSLVLGRKAFGSPSSRTPGTPAPPMLSTSQRRPRRS